MLTKSFWIGGFECACHRRRDGRRLDLIEATGHDRWLAADYARLRRVGITTVREGVRWHLVEPSPGRYDFSSLLPMVRTARDLGIEVIWDLCHYGWPDDLDIFGTDFVDRFAAYAREVARVVLEETGEPSLWAPVNEISFLSWAGGDVGYINPLGVGRGFELKVQLVRATLAAIDSLWEVDPRARVVHADPAIHIVADPRSPETAAEAEHQRLLQFQAWEMLRGNVWPQIGGHERYLDVLGVNYYPQNQWVIGGTKIGRGEPLYRPFRAILRELWERFGRPLLITETGAEGEARAPWLRYICEEVRAARRAGIPVHGICLYPILDYPGWDDERHCPTGLWGLCGEDGTREECAYLAMELELQTELFRREEETAEIQPAVPAVPPATDLSTAEEEIEHAVF